MTHEHILLAELAARRQVTYRELMACYGGRGYTYYGFTSAARRLTRRGVLLPRPMRTRRPLVLAGCCPCCGRPYDDAA